MKKIILVIFVATLAFACSKNETPVTTYCIVNNLESSESSVKYLDGTMWEVTVFCYQGDNIIKEDHLEPIPPDGGKSKKIETMPEVERVRVSFRFLPSESPLYDLDANSRNYTVTTFIVQQGIDNEIIITGETMMQNKLN